MHTVCVLTIFSAKNLDLLYSSNLPDIEEKKRHTIKGQKPIDGLVYSVKKLMVSV